MRTARRINDAEDLAQYCIDAGYRWRRTSAGGWLIYGPVDSAVIPSRWEHGRGRKNVIRSLRAAGVDLSALDGDEAQHAEDDRAPTPADMAKLVVPDRPRPVLAYSKTTDQPTTDEPKQEPTVTEQPAAEVTAEDFCDALDRIAKLETALAETRRELDRVRAQVPQAGPSERELQAQRRREHIVEWFHTLPAGFRVTAGMVYENLQVPEDERRAYGDNLRQLVTDGVLMTANGGVGERGGRHAHYELVRQPMQAAG